jgi:hypothetical protein
VTPAQVSAFKNAVGGPVGGGGYVPGDFATVFALIAAAVAILWVADMIRLLATEALDGRTTLRRAALYKLRAIVLLLLLVYLLN